MLVMTVRPQHHKLFPDEEPGRAVTELLGHLGQGHADRAYSVFHCFGHTATVGVPDHDRNTKSTRATTSRAGPTTGASSFGDSHNAAQVDGQR